SPRAAEVLAAEMVIRWQVRMTLQPDRQSTGGDRHVSSLVNVAPWAEAERRALPGRKRTERLTSFTNSSTRTARMLMLSSSQLSWSLRWHCEPPGAPASG